MGWRTAWVILVFCLLSAPCALFAQPAIGEIERAWKRRQERLASGHIEWAEVSKHAKGSMTKLLAFARSPLNGPIPPKDVTTESKYEFTWSGDRLSFGMEGWTLDIKTGEYVPVVSKEAITSATSSGIRNSGAVAYPVGRITKKPTLISHGSVLLRPIIFWLRPLDVGNGGIRIKSCRVSGSAGPDGTWNDLTLKQVHGDKTQEWHIDPQHDFAITRYEARRRDKTTAKIVMDYKEDPTLGLMPSRWSILFMPDGENIEIDCEARATTNAIGGPVADTRFHIDFPSGTWVRDETRSLEYLVLANGLERIVTRGELERGVRYQELLRTESGLGGTSPHSSLRSWVWWTASAVLLVSSVVLLARRLSQANST